MSKLFRHRHRAIRSFPTKCRECGASVLFFECECGAKAFFTLPIYGKPIRHLCEKKVGVGKRRRPWTIAKEVPEIEWKNIGKEKAFQCPCCDKVFKTELRFNSHITQMKKTDPEHRQFFETVWDLIDLDESDSEDLFDPFRVNTKISKNPGFGSVSIREQKKKKLPTTKN
ncbi:MAG: hypothetical protein EU530_07990 [Promethearchaeota archaeon]|nr:MAG: hypothetical protein EU530_07990 [Candidatus Lokiarchaeota archaeon]